MKVKLKDICTPKQWKTISTSELIESGYPVYGANGIIGYYDKYNHEIDTLLVTCRGATCGYLNISEGKAYINGNAMALDNLSKDVNIKYLYYYLKQRGFKDAISGSAQPQIIRSAIENIEVEIKNKDEQDRIVKICEKINKILHKQRVLIKLFDTLIKSQFVEMFGNMENPKYPVHNFKEFMERCVDIGSNGSNATVVEHLNMKRTKDYAFVIRFTNLNSNDYEKDVRYIDEESYNFFRKSKVYGGEIIFCKIGSAGLSYIMPKLDMPVTLGLNQIMVTPKNINTIYLYNYLNSDFGYNYLQNHCQGAVTKSITKHTLWETPIVYPPIEKQNKFESFARECGKLKFIVQKSLNETQILFDSLIQKCFT